MYSAIAPAALSRDGQQGVASSVLRGVQIDDHREIKPAFARVEIRDVSDPRTVWRGDRKLAPKAIRRGRQSMTTARRDAKPAPSPSPQAVGAHQTHHALATHPDALTPKLLVESRTAIRP